MSMKNMKKQTLMISESFTHFCHISITKFSADDFGGIVSPLCKIIAKDANIVVVQLAVRSLGGIAKGLRKGLLRFLDPSLTHQTL